MAKEYILRDKDNLEITRLGFQHRVWKEISDMAIQKAEVVKGDRIIDLGSGPGFPAKDLAEITGEEGHIYCLDSSEKFVEYINNQQLKSIDATIVDIRTDLKDFLTNTKPVDKVFSKWVLMFTGSQEKIIKEVYNGLKPGGKFISMEYFDFKKIALYPKSDLFDHIYKNVYILLKNNGGDPDIGAKIPHIMESAGFRQVEVYPIFRTGKAKSLLWQWLEMVNSNHTNLVDANLISDEELANFKKVWKERTESKISFINPPPLMITIGEK